MASSELFVSLIMKLQDSTSPELKKIGAEMDALRKKTEKPIAGGMFGSIKDGAAQANQALAAIGVGLSVAGVIAFVKSTVNQLDELRDMSLKTGIAVDRLAGLDSIAKKSGTSAQEITAAFRFINKAVIEAAQGSDDANAALKSLGTTWQEFARLSSEARFEAIITGLERIGVEGTGAKTATALLGRSYQNFIPLVKDVGSSLKEVLDQFVRNNPEMKKNADAADKLNDSLVDLGDSLRKMVNKETIEGFQDLAKSAIWAIGKVAAFGNVLGNGAEWWTDKFKKGYPDFSSKDPELDKAQNQPKSWWKDAEEARAARDKLIGKKPDHEISDTLPPWAKDYIDGEKRFNDAVAAAQEAADKETSDKREESLKQQAEKIRQFIEDQSKTERMKKEAGIAEEVRLNIEGAQASLDAKKITEEEFSGFVVAQNQMAADAVADIRKKAAELENTAQKKALADLEERGRKELEITRAINQAKADSAVADKAREARSFGVAGRISVEHGDLTQAGFLREQARLQAAARSEEIEKARELSASYEGIHDKEAERLNLETKIKDLIAEQTDSADELAESLRPLEGTFDQGFGQGLRDFKRDLGTEFTSGVSTARDAMSGLTNAFQGFIQHLQQGDIRGAMASFTQSIVSSLNEIIAKMIAMKIIGAAVGMFATGGVSVAEMAAYDNPAYDPFQNPTFSPFGNTASAPMMKGAGTGGGITINNNINAIDSKGVYESLQTQGGQRAIKEHAFALQRNMNYRREAP